MAYKRQNDIYAAEKSLKDALVVNPKAKDASYNLVQIYLNNDRAAATEAVLEEAISHHPESELLIGSLARVEAAPGRVEGVSSNLEQLVEYKKNKCPFLGYSNPSNRSTAINFRGNPSAIQDYLQRGR